MAEEKKTSKKAATGGKQNKNKPTHPKIESMVVEAVTELKERKGSSLAAIKKFIATTYKVDTVKKAIFIRKAVKKAVDSGNIVQVKGSYKLPEPEGKQIKKKATGTGSGKPQGRPKKSEIETKSKKQTPKKTLTPKKKKAITPKKKGIVTPKKKKQASSAKKPKPKSTTAKKN